MLPADEALWERLEDTVAGVMRAYGFQRIRTPIVESTRLFVRGIGEVTDIVEKEMYSFVDSLNGEALTLRPENTASVVRAVIEHNLLYTGPKKLWYAGPMFRHERPQKGRYRQFHQIGAESMGLAGPESDAELILLCARLWTDLDLPPVRLEINTLGAAEERRRHRDALIAYFEAHHDQLDEDARRRLHSNPLRILDTKNPAMQALVEGAPKMLDYLGEASRRHFAAVQAILAAAGVEWRLNPRLVRGLDYYNLTVFEFVTDSLGAQGTICGGGRYDYLIEQIGGKPAPAVGWALGVERVLELLKEEGVHTLEPAPDAYAVIPDAAALPQAMRCLQQLRALGVTVQMHAGTGEGMGSMKSQFKRADASGARHALIFGADELAAGEVTVKALRDGGGAQLRQPLSAPDAWADILKSTA
ncbi:MAG TPA: histidine--tRNA ligase [Ottowia sp.]|nr:histidine--tRNA ligase [Ottowia sp.]